MPRTIGGPASHTCVMLRSVSEPISQNTISTAAKGFCDSVRTSAISAVVRLATATPKDECDWPASLARQPQHDAHRKRRARETAERQANRERAGKSQWIASTAPRPAPPEMPMTPGSASGLRR